MNNPKVGDEVTVQWGQWRTTAVVTKVTSSGSVYGKRWNKTRHTWTSERRLYPWRGIWTTEKQ